jgi:predicted TIM-barrel fold metal-dependent hydrolase
MSRLFEVQDVDRRFYQEKLADFLPERMVDIHTHVWLRDFRKAPPTGRAVTWPLRVAEQNPVEDLVETYRLMFPGKAVKPLMFSFVEAHEDDFAGANAYSSHAAREQGFAALVFASPTWSAERLEREILTGDFLGAKVYLTLAPAHIPADEIRISDFLPQHQLEVLDRHGWIVVLHIPRSVRLRDPVNLADMLEIDQRYPNAKIIIAHVGRAYCPEDIGNAFSVLVRTRHLLFDFSANTNVAVFEQLIRTVGPRRILFGSDLPITRMRMRRICEQGNYVNLVPRGLYGDVSADSHMREVDGAEAETLSFFLYEEIEAFRQAAQTTGLTPADVEEVFCDNAVRLIEAARLGGSLEAAGPGEGFCRPWSPPISGQGAKNQEVL